MKTGLVMLLLLSALFWSGCATVLTRREQPQGELYPATTADAFCVVTGGGNLEGRISPLGYLIFSPFWLLDLPFSVVSDTVMIPHDLKWKRIYADQRSREFRMSPSVLCSNAPDLLLVSFSGYPEVQARFSFLPTMDTVTAKTGDDIVCPVSGRRYRLVYAGNSYVILRKEK